MPILTDAKGRPFDEPEPPPRDAGIEEKIDYMRRVWARNDAIADCANAAFDDEFRKALKRGE